MNELNILGIVSLCIMNFIAGGFAGYLSARYFKIKDSKVSVIQIFGMTMVLLYFTASVSGLTEFNEITLSILLAFIAGEHVGDYFKVARGKRC